MKLIGSAARYANLTLSSYKIVFLGLWSRLNNNYIVIMCLIPKLNTPFVVANISNLNPVKAISSRHNTKTIYLTLPSNCIWKITKRRENKPAHRFLFAYYAIQWQNNITCTCRIKCRYCGSIKVSQIIIFVDCCINTTNGKLKSYMLSHKLKSVYLFQPFLIQTICFISLYKHCPKQFSA